jgi:hypothetical protein
MRHEIVSALAAGAATNAECRTALRALSCVNRASHALVGGLAAPLKHLVWIDLAAVIEPDNKTSLTLFAWLLALASRGERQPMRWIQYADNAQRIARCLGEMDALNVIALIYESGPVPGAALFQNAILKGALSALVPTWNEKRVTPWFHQMRWPRVESSLAFSHWLTTTPDPAVDDMLARLAFLKKIMGLRNGGTGFWPHLKYARVLEWFVRECCENNPGRNVRDEAFVAHIVRGMRSTAERRAAMLQIVEWPLWKGKAVLPMGQGDHRHPLIREYWMALEMDNWMLEDVHLACAFLQRATRLDFALDSYGALLAMLGYQAFAHYQPDELVDTLVACAPADHHRTKYWFHFFHLLWLGTMPVQRKSTRAATDAFVTTLLERTHAARRLLPDGTAAFPAARLMCLWCLPKALSFVLQHHIGHPVTLSDMAPIIPEDGMGEDRVAWLEIRRLLKAQGPLA